MTEHNSNKYIFKTAETLHADALIQRAAQKIIQDNISNQETVNGHLSNIRQKLAQNNPKKSGMFSTSYLRKLAEKRRLLAANKMQCEVA